MDNIFRLLSNIFQRFPALRYRDYRFYFVGQLISIAGSSLHGVAHGWLVYSLTHSAFWLGVVSAVSTLPVLLFSLFGGILVDKFDRKKVLVFTQSSSLIFAFILGILTLSGLVNLTNLLIITFLAGIANAVDNPATQSFVTEIVGKNELPSAIGLNSAMFNTGRVLGPALAGFLIAMVGVGNVFIITALSFLAILVSLYFINSKSVKCQKQEDAFSAIKGGIVYSFAHPLIGVLLLTAATGAIFAFSQSIIIPVIAEKVFERGADGLGLLLSASGLGALVGSLIISSNFKKSRASRFIIFGNIIFLVSTFIFTFTTNIYFAFLLLVLSGAGLTIQFSSIYTSIQNLVKEEFRGRVSSIYVLMFVGFSPLGNLLMGSLTSYLGPLSAIRFALFMLVLYGVIVFFSWGKIRLRYQSYAQKFDPALAF